MSSGGPLSYFEVKIASGATDSTEVDLREYDIEAFVFPSAFTGATISFKSRPSTDKGSQAAGSAGSFAVPTAQVVVDSGGAAVTVTATASRHVALTQATEYLLSSLMFATIVSASSEAADRYIGIVARRQL